MPTGRKWKGDIMKETLLPFNLQLFAADNSTGGETTGTAEEPITTEPTQPTEKTFTQAEVDEIISKRLQREKEKQEKDQKEAARLAALTEAERQQELLKMKDDEIAEKTEQIRLMELKEDTTKLLNDEGINLNFMSFLMAKTAEDTKSNIDTFKRIFNEEIQKEVDKRIAGITPTIKETKLTHKDQKDLTELMREKRII